MKSPLAKAHGAILIMAAMILILLIGIAAFALDIGRLYVLHTEMQNAVDAAVISAAAELDGEAGARDRAKAAAAQDMLNHLAHFSGKIELLEDLQSESGIFTFYTWIGGSFDSSELPSDCVETEPGKCDASGDDDASYVQIRLDPELFADSDGRYEIDLYFLPVLSVLGIETPTTASTKVTALAGSHYQVCNYPPMMICDPSEGGDVLNPGEMVVLKEHSTSWEPGTFGWLVPTEVAEDPNDDTSGVNELLARRLGSIYGQKCSPPIVKIKTGDRGNWPRWG
ncbi:MAG: Tad domain-containing protein, partial [Gammaproteobacteria bacterium]|nr:Tad domain-containing protein [Gammaproteobacteria bacterium]